MDWIELIGNVAFPIAAYVAMFWYMVEKDKTHKDEVKSLSTAVENNTLVLQKLIDHLDKES